LNKKKKFRLAQSLPILLLVLGFIFVNWIMLNQLVLSFSVNSIRKHSQWSSTKFETLYYLMGADEFMDSPIPLAHEKLNLSTWHGNQEIVYNSPLLPQEINFDFELTKNSFFYILLQNSRNWGIGLRFSSNNNHENSWVKLGEWDNFEKKIPFKFNFSRQLNHAQVKFKNQRLLLFINHEFIGQYPYEISGQVFLAFRGSWLPSFIDNIVIKSQVSPTQTKLIYENFSKQEILKKSHWGKSLPIILLIFSFLISFLIISLGMNQADIKSYVFYLTTIHLCFYLITFSLIFSLKKISLKYPSNKNNQILLKIEEDDEEDENELNVNNEQKEIFTKSYHEILRTNPFSFSPNEMRVVFLGSSQTWGAGVNKSEMRWTNLVCQNLEEKLSRKQKVHCINSSVNGATSENVYEFWKENFSILKPTVSFINLMFNDPNPDFFESNLRKILEINKNNKIKTVLVVEPYNVESVENNENNLSKIRILNSLALEYKIKLLNPLPFFDEKKDDGLIWWDSIHFTPYGHKLFSEFINNYFSANKTLWNFIFKENNF